MFHTALTPPSIEQAAIDNGIARGRRTRSQVIVGTVKALFNAPEPSTRARTA